MLIEGKSVEEIIEFMDKNERSLKENPFKRKSVIISEEKAKEKKAKAEESLAQTQEDSHKEEETKQEKIDKEGEQNSDKE